MSSGDTTAFQTMGTLTSAPFTVSQPFASFSVAGQRPGLGVQHGAGDHHPLHVCVQVGD